MCSAIRQSFVAVLALVCSLLALCTGSAYGQPHQHADATRIDQVFSFRVAIDGKTQGAFHQWPGLEFDDAIIVYPAGPTLKTPQMRNKFSSYSNVSLRRGITKNTELVDWIRAALNGRIERKQLSIILVDSAGNVRKRWHARNAWPQFYRGQPLHLKNQSVTIDKIEFAHDGLEVERP